MSSKKKNNYEAGAYNFECMLCGFVKKSTVMRINWLGQLTCPICYQTKHPSIDAKPPTFPDEGIPTKLPVLGKGPVE